MIKLFAGGRNAAGRGVAASFAHLAGLAQSEKPAGEGEEASEKDAEDAAPPKKDAEDDGESPPEEAPPPKKVPPEEDDPEDEGEPEENEDAEGEDDAKKVKKAKAAGFGPAIAAARRMERARCGAILGHASAAKNVALAASLACETTLSVHQAISVMEKGVSSSGSRLSQAMAEVGSPRISASGSRGPRDTSADAWGVAMQPYMPQSR